MLRQKLWKRRRIISQGNYKVLIEKFRQRLKNIMEQVNLKSTNHESTFLKGAFVLSLGGFITKAIGAIYRIPLTNILGAEGIGMYQLVFPLYILLLTISSAGLPSAISRLISESGKQMGDYIFKIALLSLAFFGLTFSIALFFLAPVISKLQGNSNVTVLYYAICPSVFFVALISAFRGFFQGRLKMSYTAVSQITEQVVKAGFSILFSILFMPDVMRAVFFIVLSVSISEVIALLYLFLQFIRFKKKRKDVFTISSNENLKSKIDKNSKQADNKFKALEIFKLIYKISIPATLTALILPLSQLVDSSLVVKYLNSNNFNGTVLFGLLSGPVFSIINLPTVFAAAIATTCLPLLSKHRAFGETAQLKTKINYAFKLIFLIVLPSSLVIYFYSDEISYFLYRGLSAENLEILSDLLKISSVGVIFLSLTQVCASILIAIKKTYVGLLSLLTAIIIKIVLNIILLNYSDLNIFGPAIASIVCYAVSSLICFLYIIVYTRCGFKIFTQVAIFAIISFASVFSIYFFRKYIFNFEGTISFLSALALSLMFFLLLAFMFKILTKNDIKKLHF